MTLDEYLEALYDACFEEYCIENNIVTLLDPLEYFEERTSERKQRVQQQRKDAKKLAKTPIEQRPNPNAGAKTYADKVEEGKRKFLDRAHYDPKTKTIEIMGNKFEIDLQSDSGAACVFEFGSGKRYLKLDNTFYLSPPKHQDATILHELAHKRLGHGIGSASKYSDWDIDLSKTNDRKIAEILRKNGIKPKELHGIGPREVEADASAANVVGERTVARDLRNSVLHSNSNRQIRRDISRTESEIGDITEKEKKWIETFTTAVKDGAESEIQNQIWVLDDDKVEEKRELQRAIGDSKNPIYRKALEDSFYRAKNNILCMFKDPKTSDRMEKIFDTCPIAKKIYHQQTKEFRKDSKSEVELRSRIQQLPEIRELRKKDERYHTPDRTKGESKGEYEDFIDRYIAAKPNMRKYQDASKQASSDYSKYKQLGTISSITKKYTDMGVDIDKAFPEKIDMNDWSAISRAKATFIGSYKRKMPEDEYGKYLDLFRDLFSRASLRSRVRGGIRDARSAKSDVDKDIRKAYSIKDSAKKFNTDLQNESISIFDEGIFDDMTDDQLEQYMIEMYEDAIRYNTISAMIDRMYDLGCK